MKSILFCLAFLFASTVGFTQADFRKGYVVNATSDTLFGLIDYRGNMNNGKECRFRKSLDSDVIVYQPNEISAYRYENSKYFLAKTLADGRTVFLEYLINGTVDIYFLRDENGDRYFLDSGDGQLRELAGGEVEVRMNEQRYVKKNKKYVGQLKVAFAQSPRIQRQSETLQLNHKSLIKIAKEYHEEVCSTESCIVYEKRIPARITTWGIAAAFNSYHITPDRIRYPDNYAYFETMEFNRANYPSAGLFLRSNLPTVNEKLYFTYEVLLNYRKFTGLDERKTGSVNAFVTETHTLPMKQLGVSNAILFGYQAPKGRIKPTFSAGGFYELLIKNDYYVNFTRTYSWSPQYNYEGTSKEAIFTNSDFGFVLGAGIVSKTWTQKDWSIDFRYYYGIGMSMSGFVMDTRSVALMLKYPL